VLRFGPASEWIVWPIPAFLTPFAAVFYPVSTLPEWMRQVAYALPPSYVFEGMRAVVSGGGSRGPPAIVPRQDFHRVTATRSEPGCSPATARRVLVINFDQRSLIATSFHPIALSTAIPSCFLTMS
jgi:hypothetical protein